MGIRILRPKIRFSKFQTEPYCRLNIAVNLSLKKNFRTDEILRCVKDERLMQAQI